MLLLLSRFFCIEIMRTCLWEEKLTTPLMFCHVLFFYVHCDEFMTFVLKNSSGPLRRSIIQRGWHVWSIEHRGPSAITQLSAIPQIALVKQGSHCENMHFEDSTIWQVDNDCQPLLVSQHMRQVQVGVPPETCCWLNLDLSGSEQWPRLTPLYNPRSLWGFIQTKTWTIWYMCFKLNL